MRRSLNWLVFVLAVGAVTYFVVLSFRPEPVAVEVAEAACGPMQVTVEVEGRTRVRNRFVVSSPVSGTVSRIAYREGDALNRGAVIAQLKPAPLDERTLRTAQAASQAADAARQAAVANAERARVALDQARRDHERAARLAEQGIASAHERERAEAALADAQKAYETARMTAEAARFEAEEAAAALLFASPASSSAPMAVRSPAKGRVLRVIERSEHVVNAGDPLIEVADAGELELVFEVLSTDAVRIPAEAEVIVENWGGEQTLEASVRTVEPAAFTKVSALGVEEQRVNVVAVLSRPEVLLADGYRVEGKIVIWQAGDVLKVPVSALFKRDGSWHVFVLSGNVAVARRIEVGRRNDVAAEVRSGLNDGERVILYPDDRISDGVLVNAGP